MSAVVSDLRAQIQSVEAAMRAHPEALSAKDFVTRHYFAYGLYAREIEIPAGMRLIGKIHLYEHLNIVSKGRILVFTEDGEREIVAPCTFIARPGTQRAGCALEDTIWTTVHSTNETDIDKAEKALVTDTHEQYLEHVKGALCRL